MSKGFLIFVAMFVTGCCTIHNQEMVIRVDKNSVKKVSGNEYSMVYNGKRTILKHVVDLVWLNDEPYFEVSDYKTMHKIMKWDRMVAEHAAFNLQKRFNKIYFLKQYAAGAEPCSVSLNIIDSSGHKELVIKKNGKPEIFEDYFVLYSERIYVELLFIEEPPLYVPWVEQFALIDSVGNVVKIYELKNETGK